MITSEVEPLGGFIGDAVAQPAFQGGTLLTILVFMFAQDVVLGFAAVALYPLQIYLIPKLQRQVNALAKERVRTVRRLAETNRREHRRHRGDPRQRHVGMASRRLLALGRHDLRHSPEDLSEEVLYQVSQQFYCPADARSSSTRSAVIWSLQGELTFGALVAVLSAYKDLSSPWKELLDWYQQKEDTRVKYDQLVEQFRPAGMLPEDLQKPADVAGAAAYRNRRRSQRDAAG